MLEFCVGTRTHVSYIPSSNLNFPPPQLYWCSIFSFRSQAASSFCQSFGMMFISPSLFTWEFVANNATMRPDSKIWQQCQPLKRQHQASSGQIDNFPNTQESHEWCPMSIFPSYYPCCNSYTVGKLTTFYLNPLWTKWSFNRKFTGPESKFESQKPNSSFLSYIKRKQPSATSTEVAKTNTGRIGVMTFTPFEEVLSSLQCTMVCWAKAEWKSIQNTS